MTVMLANYDRAIMHYWSGRGFPVGHLVSYQDWNVNRFYPWLPAAFDNGIFQGGDSWSAEKYFKMLEAAKLNQIKPLWALVPDCVGDAAETRRRWDLYRDRVAGYGWQLGYALQDGSSLTDVPIDADIVFVGGTTDWKWKNVKRICEAFPRVHVGRVNQIERVWFCDDCGAESIDGTGWFRDGELSWKMMRLQRYFTGERDEACSLFSPPTGDSTSVEPAFLVRNS